MQAAAPGTDKPLRLFVAIWPDEEVRAAIAAWQQAWVWPAQADPVKSDRMHLTLHFIGDVPAGRLPELSQGLAAPFEPFTLELDQGDVWPSGVAVLRPHVQPPQLLRLHQDLRERLVSLGLPVETRPYRAHVTLARRARGAKPPERGAGLRWRIGAGYVLVRSLPGGAGYRLLERFE
jgi:RNA 2',3'-cyclic 3'-phosphodiesterase